MDKFHNCQQMNKYDRTIYYKGHFHCTTIEFILQNNKNKLMQIIFINQYHKNAKKKSMSHLDKTRNLLIYQKVELMYKLVESLMASLAEDDEYTQTTKGFLCALIQCSSQQR